MNSTSQQYLIPKAGLLDQFKNFPDTVAGSYLKDIPENTLIEIQAVDITLHLAIIDRDSAKVAVKGNVNFFTTPEICRLEGSTLMGSFLKTRWIGVGFNLELHRLNEPPLGPSRRITTSTMQSIIIWQDPASALALIEEALKNSRKKSESGGEAT